MARSEERTDGLSLEGERTHEVAERLRGAARNAPAGMALKDMAGRVLWSNPALQSMLGYEDEELRGMFRTEFTHPGDAGEDTKLYEELLRGERESFQLEKRYVRKDGSFMWGRLSVFRVEDEPDLALVIVDDIDARKSAEEELGASETRFRTVAHSLGEGLLITDLDDAVLYANPRVAELTGYAEEEMLGRRAYEVLLPRERWEEARRRNEERAWGTGDRYETQLRRKDGTFFWAEVSAAPYRDTSGEVIGTVGALDDVTERKEFEEELQRQALHDTLTGLPNRALLVDRLRHALKRSARRGGHTAVLFVDLDNFKVVNDSLGHEAGDRLLMAVAERMRTVVRPEDTVARLGGDEFIFLLEEAGLEEATHIAERVLERLRSPFELKRRKVFTTPSIGVALSDAGKRAEDLLRDADVAMYRAKRMGKARYAVFEEGMDARALERLDLEHDLRRALERAEFEVRYQPKVSLPSGEVVGFEALARWRHPERGLVLPGEFIPLAEETGLIVPIGEVVLAEACRRTREWHERHHQPVTVCVNLSARQFREPGLTRTVVRILEETGLDPSTLLLEVTESAAMGDAPATAAALEELKDFGVRAILDDFGTGYSALSYLQLFPVDFVKIDRSFVGKLGEDPGAAVLTKGVIDLAHALGLQVIAEGVETKEQHEQLVGMGCDFAQGYHFWEPLRAEAAGVLLDTRRRL